MVGRLSSGRLVGEVAAAAGVTDKAVFKWHDRFAAEGEIGLQDQSPRPLCGPRRLGVPVSTVGLALRRLGLGRLRALAPRPEVIRYPREPPGELIHFDIQKLRRIDGIGHRITRDRTGQGSKRGTGCDDLHVVIDDASRLAFTGIMADKKKESTTGSPIQALD